MILAIDPGTKCGWALRNNDGAYISGVWNLKGNRFEGAGMRFVRLRRVLDEISGVTEVVFEEVRRHLGTDAAHIYGGIIAVITAWAEENKIPYAAVPVGTVKSKATGKGNASKDAMMEAAKERWPGYQFEDDNEADARWILEAWINGKKP